MNLIFLPSTKGDLRWFRRYYSTVFPEGGVGAKAQLLKARQLLLTYPQVGHIIEGEAPMRELPIPRTSFSLVYFIDGQNIVVIRLFDNRSERPAQFGSRS